MTTTNRCDCGEIADNCDCPKAAPPLLTAATTWTLFSDLDEMIAERLSCGCTELHGCETHAELDRAVDAAAAYYTAISAENDRLEGELTALRKNIAQVDALKEEAWARETALREAADGMHAFLESESLCGCEPERELPLGMTVPVLCDWARALSGEQGKETRQ